jgi:hypothetical protein
LLQIAGSLDGVAAETFYGILYTEIVMYLALLPHIQVVPGSILAQTLAVPILMLE